MHRQSAPQNAAAGRLALTTLLRRKGRVLDAVSGTCRRSGTGCRRTIALVLDKLSARAASSQRWRCAGQAARIRKRLQTTSGGSRRRFNGSNGTSAPAAPSIGRSPVRSRSRRSRPRSHPTRRSWSSHSTVPSTTGSRSATSDLALLATLPTSSDGPAGRPPSISAMRRRSIVRWKRCDRCCGIPRAQVCARRRRRSTERSCAALPHLEGARHLLISPDAALNLVPFAALLDPTGRYLLETREISYLTSGRDLLRLQEPAVPGSRPLVVANPAFDSPTSSATAPPYPDRASVRSTFPARDSHRSPERRRRRMRSVGCCRTPRF